MSQGAAVAFLPTELFVPRIMLEVVIVQSADYLTVLTRNVRNLEANQGDS